MKKLFLSLILTISCLEANATWNFISNSKMTSENLEDLLKETAFYSSITLVASSCFNLSDKTRFSLFAGSLGLGLSRYLSGQLNSQKNAAVLNAFSKENKNTNSNSLHLKKAGLLFGGIMAAWAIDLKTGAIRNNCKSLIFKK